MSQLMIPLDQGLFPWICPLTAPVQLPCKISKDANSTQATITSIKSKLDVVVRLWLSAATPWLYWCNPYIAASLPPVNPPIPPAKNASCWALNANTANWIVGREVLSRKTRSSQSSWSPRRASASADRFRKCSRYRRSIDLIGRPKAVSTVKERSLEGSFKSLWRFLLGHGEASQILLGHVEDSPTWGA